MGDSKPIKVIFIYFIRIVQKKNYINIFLCILKNEFIDYEFTNYFFLYVCEQTLDHEDNCKELKNIDPISTIELSDDEDVCIY